MDLDDTKFDSRSHSNNTFMRHPIVDLRQAMLRPLSGRSRCSRNGDQVSQGTFGDRVKCGFGASNVAYRNSIPNGSDSPKIAACSS